jgi:hypothetical protein
MMKATANPTRKTEKTRGNCGACKSTFEKHTPNNEQSIFGKYTPLNEYL